MNTNNINFSTSSDNIIEVKQEGRLKRVSSKNNSVSNFKPFSNTEENNNNHLQPLKKRKVQQRHTSHTPFIYCNELEIPSVEFAQIPLSFKYEGKLRHFLIIEGKDECQIQNYPLDENNNLTIIPDQKCTIVEKNGEWICLEEF